MVFSSLFPVFALLVFGRVLKHFNLTNDTFLKTSDRLVYYIFFPMLLFWKIGNASSGTLVDSKLNLAALGAVLCTYLVSTAAIQALKIPAFKAGSFSQSCYRFNTYIGMAIVINAVGESGTRLFGVLVSIVIPVINVLAVSTLIWFSGRSFDWRQRSKHTLKALVSNPLIIACAAGILYARVVGLFPPFIENTLRLSAAVTLPLALLSVGSLLNFKVLRGHLTIALIGSVFKLLVLPVVGYLFLRLFGVTDLPLKVGMIFFALPTSTAIYVLSSQLYSDTELASASIALSTVLSFASLSAVLAVF
jgi:predicted permease